MSAEFKVFTALVVLIGVVVIVAISLDIYLHPPDPRQVGTATVEISGTTRFRGEVGTAGDTLIIEGKAPVSVEVPFARADFVVAQMEESPGDLSPTLKIRVKDRTVAKSSGGLVSWDVPRDFKP
jgi:hypothetical protein